MNPGEGAHQDDIDAQVRVGEKKKRRAGKRNV